jgi:hypothetical protein
VRRFLPLIISAFTAWPFCIATYVTLAGIIGLIVTNWTP